jgi:hypothetical protein
MLQTQKLLQAQHYTFSCLTSSNLVLWGSMANLSAAQGTVCARYLLLKDLPLPGWVRATTTSAALTSSKANQLIFYNGHGATTTSTGLTNNGTTDM